MVLVRQDDGRRFWPRHDYPRLRATARELLDGAGIAKQGDVGGPRWVAIRHAEDHIHIAAVLVRQDTSRRFWPHHVDHTVSIHAVSIRAAWNVAGGLTVEQLSCRHS